MGENLKCARGNQDGIILPGQGERGDILLVQLRREAHSLSLSLADGQHFRRVIDPIDIDTLGEIVENQLAGRTAHVEHGLAIAAQDIQIEIAVFPIGGIISP